MSSSEVVCVYNDLGDFYDVYPRISRSLGDMRDKILGIVGVKWEWHVVLTFDDKTFNDVVSQGGFSGDVLEGFLKRTKTIYKSSRKFFWKYEEGRLFGRAHYHMLFEFKKRFNQAYVLKKLFPYGWEHGKVNVKRLINRQRKYHMNRNKTDVEILMGLLLRRKWRNGIVYAKQIEGLGKAHQKNLVYYVNKDLLKPTGFSYSKAGAVKWHFGLKYKFKKVSLFSYKQKVSVNKCIHKMLTTKWNFIEYYDSFGKNGYSFFFKKVRDIKKGEYFKVIK